MFSQFLKKRAYFNLPLKEIKIFITQLQVIYETHAAFSILHGLGPSFNPRTASGIDTRDCNSIYCSWEQIFPPTIVPAEANPPGSSSAQLHGHWQSTQQGHGDFTAHSNLLSKTSALSETAPRKARSCALLIQYKNTMFSEIVTEAIVISE